MIPRIELDGGYEISRIIKGGWHLAGDHAKIEPQQAREDMASFVETGITTFDCADIYTGVEELIGSFRRTFPMLALSGAMLYLIEPRQALAFIVGLIALAIWLHAFLRNASPSPNATSLMIPASIPFFLPCRLHGKAHLPSMPADCTVSTTPSAR